MTIRNIINQEEISAFIEEKVMDSALDAFPMVKKWLQRNVKNYLIKNKNFQTLSLEDLDTEKQAWIKSKNIQAPYHCVVLDVQWKEELNHALDFLRDEYVKDKDLSRVSVDQAFKGSRQWLADRLENLSSEEDHDHVKDIFEIDHEGRRYCWKNIRSKKALERESALMGHCIESFWNKQYSTPFVESETPFYSLRDDQNKPLVTMELYQKDLDHKLYQTWVHAKEIKMRFNAFLDTKARQMVVEFF